MSGQQLYLLLNLLQLDSNRQPNTQPVRHKQRLGQFIERQQELGLTHLFTLPPETSIEDLFNSYETALVATGYQY